MLILGIETSCDETAASVIKCENGKINILSNVVSSQIKLHAEWGGVVPNLAAREHLKNIIPVVKTALTNADVKSKQVDLIAVTNGPGLIPALLVGTTAAKTLAYSWKKPLIGIHHIEGHIYANFIGEVKDPLPADRQEKAKSKNKEIKSPILCLVVSGGHTQLVLMKEHLRYEVIGETLDDASGEAFDKVSRILGLGYPGGPAISRIAKQFPRPSIPYPSIGREAPDEGISLPRPMINSKDFNFSFSGLKTAVLYLVKNNPQILKDKRLVAEVCHEFQQAVIDVLISKTIQAARKHNPRTIMLAGGVSANRELRRQLKESVQKNLKNTLCMMPNAEYSIDNAAMIAAAAFYRWKNMTERQKQQAMQNWKILPTDANLKMRTK